MYYGSSRDVPGLWSCDFHLFSSVIGCSRRTCDPPGLLRPPIAGEKTKKIGRPPSSKVFVMTHRMHTCTDFQVFFSTKRRKGLRLGEFWVMSVIKTVCCVPGWTSLTGCRTVLFHVPCAAYNDILPHQYSRSVEQPCMYYLLRFLGRMYLKHSSK